jgi:Fe-coproporphyrin III synthase
MQISDEIESCGTGTLMVHLLGRCNLVCQHCYMEGGPERRERIPVEYVLEAIEACPALGIGTLYLTGGEPLLYPDLKQVVSEAVAVPGLSVTVSTNATMLTPRRVNFFAAQKVRLNVSIDGEPDFHDAFRRHQGAFAKTEAAVRAAVAAGIKVTIVTTISRANLTSLPRLVERAIHWGVATFRVQPLLRLGRGAILDNQRLTASEMDQLILQLSDLSNQHRAVLRCSIIGLSRRFLLAHPCAAYVCNGAGCHRRVAKEIKKIVIREDGTILPEATNLNRRFAIGKLGEAPILELIRKYFEVGYERFDQLCRTAYQEVLPTWSGAIVPWDQIIAERSHERLPNVNSDRNASPSADVHALV